MRKDIIKTNNNSYSIEEYIISFSTSNFNLKSLEEFIIRINELSSQHLKKLKEFKNELQSRIQDENQTVMRICLLVYFAVKDFITDARLELLSKWRDHGVDECINEYPNEYPLWRIKNTIINTRWKYMNKAYSSSDPVIDQNNKIHYKKYELHLKLVV